VTPLAALLTAVVATGRLSDLTDWLSSLADWAAEHGYLAVLLIVAGDGVFPFFPGETAIIFAAVLAAQGSLDLWLVILVGAVGAIIGDSTAYAMGHVGKGPIRRSVIRIAGEERLTIAEHMIDRYGPALVFVSRFLPGMRIAINMSCGAGQMRYRRFLLFNGLGSVVWSLQAALIGFFAGKAFAEQLWVAFVVALGVAFAVGAFITYKERQRIREEKRRMGLAAGE
jgi:membrane-associated protein